MKRVLLLLALCLLQPFLAGAADSKPLRVFIRAGEKTHGPNQHDHPRFLKEYTELLKQRGMEVDGALAFPTDQQLEKTDVIVLYCQEGGSIHGAQRESFEKFLKRGGGVVVIHDAVCGDDAQWFKTVVGGAWEHGKAKWLEGEVGLYFVDNNHPITQGISNFDWKDEIYYEMHMQPDAHILASSFHSVFVIAPQLWTYEKTWQGGTTPYRAFVSIPGHEYTSFQTPHYRALLLRGIAWAGKRANADEFTKPEELASLTYPEGGPTDPAKAGSKFIVHPDFNVNLVTSEPLVEKVISLDWDTKGRMWVAETPEYPGGRTINKNDLPAKPYRALDPEKYSGANEVRSTKDRISWLEDSDGDGRMDKKHVFYDGLELVTSVVFYKDGVIVAQAPDILWIRDTNHDGKADKVEKLYTGFGTFDTHAVINNFRWGMDGWIYGAVGYSAGDVFSGDKSKHFTRLTAGIIRFRPDGSALEQYASGSCNTWGFDFGPDGEAFYTTATCGEHFLHIVMPEKVMARGNVGNIRASAVLPDHQKIFQAVHPSRPAYVQIDWVGGFTAAAGSCIYNGGAWPEEWNGNHFTSEATTSMVHHEALRPNGTTYIASKAKGREEQEFFASTDYWFRPIHQRVGPDGALYIVDFYNQAAIHNDTRGPNHGARNAATRPDRDHHFGRVWRIQHKQAKALPAWKLDGGDQAGLVTMLDHPNGWVRGTAERLLTEAGPAAAPALAAGYGKLSTAYGRINALWAMENSGKLEEATLVSAIKSDEPIVRKNAFRVVSERGTTVSGEKQSLIEASLQDTDARARLNAIIALGNAVPSAQTAAAVVKLWPSLKDKYEQSAVVGVAAKDPVLYAEAVFKSVDPAFAADFLPHLVRALANRQDAELTSRFVRIIAAQPAATEGLKQTALESLASSLRPSVVPAWTPDLAAALKSFLASSRPGLPGAVLPLLARWDVKGELSNELKPVVGSLAASLGDSGVPDERRAQIAVNLLGVRKLDAAVVPAVAKILAGPGSLELHKRIAEALGATGDASAGPELLAAYLSARDEVKEMIFTQLLKRGDWAMGVVKAIEEKKVLLAVIGPANLHRLRTHNDKTVASKAVEVIDAIRGPETKEKDTLIAQFRPIVEKPGNVENGHKLFLQNCANCHAFKTEGRDLAPNLTGMGAHGAGELLVHIVDPNRLVEPNFISAGIETKDDQSYDGIIARENATELVLRNASGDYTIRQDNIKSRKSTGLSLMPNGFEALGGEGLRDLLTFICADENKFRILDLQDAFTADSTKGIYASEQSRDESLRFRKFGIIKVGDIPFEIVSPQKSRTGKNVVVLKGGAGLAQTFAQRVEIPGGFEANRLHVLGGVGGWAWPCCGDDRHEGLDAAKVTVSYKDGGSEEIVLKNGVHFADYNGDADVPGSKPVPDLLRAGQVRWFTINLKKGGSVSKVVLESFSNFVAPTFVAITADNGPAGAAPTASAPAPMPVYKGTLIVGGNTSHDFARWFGEEDSKTLGTLGGPVFYTEKVSTIAPSIKNLDVIYLSNNQPLPDPAIRQGIFEHLKAGKGIMLLHAALWYSWADWPEYNRQLVGGGARSHDRFGEFEVVVTVPGHPVMKGVPEKFKIKDELYHFMPDAAGSPIEVLATAKSPNDGRVFPIVWITKNGAGRVVCTSLGHNGDAHQLPAYQTLLKNAHQWAAGKL